MGLFDDLQQKTKTPQQIEQEKKERLQQLRMKALESKIAYIKWSITKEAEACAQKGVRKLVLKPYYVYGNSDYSSRQKFHTQMPPPEVMRRLYSIDPRNDVHNYYGFIPVEDRAYILEKTEEFLRGEGFPQFRVAFEKEYRNPEKLLFKSPTGRNVLTVRLEW